MRIALFKSIPPSATSRATPTFILEALEARARLGAALAVTPELSLVGYLPRDLLLNAGFVHRELGRSTPAWRARRRRCRR